MAESLVPSYKWRKTPDIAGVSMPRPRHGHRAVQIKELVIVFGGGNEGIVDELHVFNTTQNAWFVPQCKGETPPGCAAFGFAVENTRLLVHGGMVEYGKYSGDLYELQATKWEWKKLKPKPPRNGPPPCPRLGHSFTLVNKKIYLFGGLCNSSPEAKSHTARFMPFRYLNDLYVLDISKNPHQWEIPEVTGTPPSPRESHTMVLWRKNDGTPEQKDYLVLYGGMMGVRLGDLWLLDLDTMNWQRLAPSGIPPPPRSLHSAVVGNNKMFVFGGWVPREKEKDNDDPNLNALQKEWKCTNSLGVFDLEANRWDLCNFEGQLDVPKARAGHCSAMVHNRMYVWSGRDGYKKQNDSQVCCNDMWFLETQKPTAPGKVQLLRASTNSLDVHWTAAMTAESYHLQIQVYESPPSANPSAKATVTAGNSLATTGAAKQLVTVPQGKNLPSGAQFVTLMKPGTTQGITLTPGSAVPVSGMVKLVPQGVGQTVLSGSSKPGAVVLGSSPKPTPKPPLIVVPTQQGLSNSRTSSPITVVPAGADSKDLAVLDDKKPDEGTPDAVVVKDKEPASVTPVVTASTEVNGVDASSPLAKDAVEKLELVEPKKEEKEQEPAQKVAPSPMIGISTEAAASTSATPKPSVVGGDSTAAKEKLKDDGLIAKLWYTVGFFTDATAPVSFYYVPKNDGDEGRQDGSIENGASFSPKDMVKHPLLPGTAYKFRVAGINLCGRGTWSEMSAFKTCLPGFPGAPSNIKITKCPDGALLTWEPPTNHGDNISEYAVYLATKPHNVKTDVPIPTSQLSFVKVYDNPTPTCTITHESLRYAYYDSSGQKPAIIFRIAAKNEKGYGPATQVRWLQETMPIQPAR